MGKALTGAIELGGAVALGAAAFLDPVLIASPLYDKAIFALALGGISSEVGALADAITGNRGINITTRQSAGYRKIIYGEQRIGGTLVFNSTTGSHHDQDNNVIVLAGHTIDGIVGLYLDGRQVFFNSGQGQTTCPGGYVFGGNADGGKHYDSGGYSYNFGGLVYCTAYYGYQTAAGGADGSLNANDKLWSPSASGVPYGGGLSWVYLKYEYDQVTFPSLPEIKFTVRGKNDIWDPRTNTTGYTTNWALCVADLLLNAEFGFGCSQTEINTPQLIAAANICDEPVPLSAGGTEPRYTLNSSWDTSTAPGDALRNLLSAAQGNVYISGGQWYIVPASAPVGVTSFGEADLLDDVQWSGYRSQRELVNRVRGIYTAPNYPYAPSGNLYDANGKDPDGYQQDNFNYAWQPTDYPEYAADANHGYASDAYLEQDGGTEFVGQLNLPCTISVATAQRLAKIYLERNRQQGTGVLTMSLAAWQLAPYDVFGLTYAPFGWANKLLQVVDIQLASDTANGAPRYYCQVSVREYDPTVYSWATGEEQDVLGNPAPSIYYETSPQTPTELTINSGAGYDMANGDGVLIPRVQVAWNQPLDIRVVGMQVDWSPSGANIWISNGTGAPVDLGYCFINSPGPSAGQVIDVRIRSHWANGAVSPYLQATGYKVSATSLSSVSTIGQALGTVYALGNDATIDTIVGPNNLATLRVYGPGGPGTNWDFITGAGTISIFPTQVQTPYSNTGYIIFTFNRGAAITSPSALNGYDNVTNYNDTVGDDRILVGQWVAISAPPSGTPTGSGGTGGTVGGGGYGGNGGYGPRGPSCTVEHTLLNTPDGPVDNVHLANRVHMGLPTYLMGRDGPEQIASCHWHWVNHHHRIKVGAVEFGCSRTHTLSVDGVHKHCELVPSGAMVDTCTGPQRLERMVVLDTVRVLHITLSGPSHEYSVGGVWTHNVVKAQGPNSN